jgi:PAS domain S-box-containing protein
MDQDQKVSHYGRKPASIRKKDALHGRAEELSLSEAFFRNTFEYASIGMAIGVPDGTFARTNAAFDRIMGYEPGELIGVHRTAVTPPEDVVENEERYRRFLKTGLPSLAYERRYVRKDGGVIWVDLNVSFIRDADGDAKFSIIMARDITDRSRVQEERIRLATAVEETAEGISIVALDNTVLYVNPAWCHITGYSREEVVGHSIDIIRKKGLSQDTVISIDRAKAEGRPWSGRVKLVRKDGRVYDADLRISPMTNADGKVLGGIGITRDITEELKMEEQLRHAQKMEAVGTLAGGVAHDFNNILMALLGYGNLLQRKMEQNDPLKVYVDHIIACAGKAVNLTQSLLVFGRKQAMELKPHRVNTRVREVEKLLRRLLPEDIDLLLSLGDDVTVMADMTQIDQVLINLATNARDAMPAGGELRIETREVKLDRDFKSVHGYGEPGEYALIAVTDTGTGMDEKTREKIFEPFFTTKEVGKGTGLGLSIVYGIVKQHGGYITVYSEQNMGTTFRLYLPAVKAKTLKAQRIPAGMKGKGGTETILFAEDDPDIRRAVRDILHMSGYTVIEAADGHNAVEKFMEHRDRIDLLILDVVMPVKNGKEVYEEIKAMKPTMRALFMSGYTSDVILGKGIRTQAVNFVPKPISPSELLQKVREVLDK